MSRFKIYLLIYTFLGLGLMTIVNASFEPAKIEVRKTEDTQPQPQTQEVQKPKAAPVSPMIRRSETRRSVPQPQAPSVAPKLQPPPEVIIIPISLPAPVAPPTAEESKPIPSKDEPAVQPIPTPPPVTQKKEPVKPHEEPKEEEKEENDELDEDLWRGLVGKAKKEQNNRHTRG